jgi:hypothetical protein
MTPDDAVTEIIKENKGWEKVELHLPDWLSAVPAHIGVAAKVDLGPKGDFCRLVTQLIERAYKMGRKMGQSDRIPFRTISSEEFSEQELSELRVKAIRQSQDAFYVCVRSRASGSLEVRLPEGGFGAFTSIEAAGKALVGAIGKYGTDYRCILEPVEFNDHRAPEDVECEEEEA